MMMATLADRATQSQRECVALLYAAEARGDLAATAADALLLGRVLFVLADGAGAPLAEQIAAAIRSPFAAAAWPPVLTVTQDPSALALVGSDYAVARPICQQVELLARAGDVALVLAPPEPSADLAGAAALAASQGVTVAGLGLPPCPIDADPAVILHEAAAAQIAACQIALGLALADTLAERLPPEPPAGVDAPVVVFGCTNCGGPLVAVRHLAGRQGVCPHCYNNTTLAPGTDGGGEQRASLRFALRQCTLGVALAPPNRPLVAVPGRIELENLGRGGLLFAVADCTVHLDPGDRVVMELTTPAFAQPLELTGSILRITREADRHCIGVVFTGLAPATAERLRILERNLVLRNLARAPD